MTEKDTLRALAADMEHALRQWPEFAAIERADGFPRSTPGSGSIGRSSDISDPTATAAMEREPRGRAEHLAGVAIANMADLAWSLWSAVREPGTTPAQWHDRQPVQDAERARIALLSCVKHWHQRPDTVAVWDGLELDWLYTTDVISAMQSQTQALRHAMRLPPVDTAQAASRARCHGGTLEQWARPECERLAVTSDGLCHACDRRRRRHEAGEAAAA
jgi:hypothetical protein